MEPRHNITRIQLARSTHRNQLLLRHCRSLRAGHTELGPKRIVRTRKQSMSFGAFASEAHGTLNFRYSVLHGIPARPVRIAAVRLYQRSSIGKMDCGLVISVRTPGANTSGNRCDQDEPTNCAGHAHGSPLE